VEWNSDRLLHNNGTVIDSLSRIRCCLTMNGRNGDRMSRTDGTVIDCHTHTLIQIGMHCRT
jgi:hypothetical protein